MNETDKAEAGFIFDLISNPNGLIFPFNLRNRELIFLRSGGNVVEFMGMVKGGKSKQIRVLKEGDSEHPEIIGLENDPVLTEYFGRKMDIQIFKPNSLVKVLCEKDENLRASYNKSIIHGHGMLLNMLSLHIKQDVIRYLQEHGVKIREIDLAILDRGPNDDVVWTNALFDYKRLISAEERDYHLRMARHLERHVDLAIGMNVVPETAKEREGAREGKVMSIPFLRILYGNYGMISDEAEKGRGQPKTIQTPYQDIDGIEDYLINARTIYDRVKRLYLPQRAEELTKRKGGLENCIG